jgi:hypothetical protein
MTMSRNRRSKQPVHFRKARKKALKTNAGPDRKALQAAYKSVQRSLAGKDVSSPNPRALLTLQQAIGNRNVQDLVQNQFPADAQTDLSAAPGPSTVQRADEGYSYEFEEDAIYGGGGTSFDNEAGDQGGEGYGYDFGEGGRSGADYYGGGGEYEQDDQDQGGEGYGYDFGEGDQGGGGYGGGDEYEQEEQDQGGEGYGYEFGEDPLSGF